MAVDFDFVKDGSVPAVGQAYYVTTRSGGGSGQPRPHRVVPRIIALVKDQPALSSLPSAAGGAFPAIGQGTPNLEDRPVSSAIA